ncbi:MAG: ATP-grasp domain-containing protein, partial [Nitrospinota bacterium]
CVKESVRLVIPTIDEELPIFGRHKEEFANLGITVMISGEKTGSICMDKYETSLFFKKHNLPFAETFLPKDIDPAEITYPLFIKPRQGRGSVGAYRVDNERELVFFKGYVREPIIQRFLEGKEFTIDLLSDLKGRVLSVVPRERVLIRSGVCDRGVTVKDPALIDFGVKIAEGLGITGPANFQCKVHDGRVTFFELNPRFSGAIQLTLESGADFPRMIIKMALGQHQKPVIGDFTDGLKMVSYEESIYFRTGEEDVSLGCTP